MTVTFDAEQIIEQNGYVVTTDFTATNVEYWIDDSIDYINLLAETSIPHMTGSAGSKTLTVSLKANAALKPLLACVLRENKKTALTNSNSTGSSSGTASSIGVGPISVSESSSVSSSISAAAAINSINNTIYREMFMTAIEQLKKNQDLNWNRAII